MTTLSMRILKWSLLLSLARFPCNKGVYVLNLSLGDMLPERHFTVLGEEQVRSLKSLTERVAVFFKLNYRSTKPSAEINRTEKT